MQRPTHLPPVVPLLLLICTLLLGLLLSQDVPGSAMPTLLLNFTEPATLLSWSALLVLLVLG